MNPTVKNMKFLQGGKVILILDDKTKIRTSEGVVHELLITSGSEISAEVRISLEDLNNYKACLNKAYDFLSRRPHGRKELFRKLARSLKFTQADIQQVMSEIERQGYLDDEEFCRLYIEDSFNLRPNDGPSKIRQKLLVKGLERSIIDKILDEMARAPEEEIEKLMELAARKWRTYPEKLDFYKKKEKLYRFLSGKGFASHLTGLVVREFTQSKKGTL
jgi:regulatory protein